MSTFTEKDDSVKLKWFGQAGYLLSCENSSLTIDPYFSDAIAGIGFVRLYPPSVEKGGLEVGAVISTHDHGDHLDVETLRDYITFSHFYGPELCVNNLMNAGFPQEKLNLLNRGDTVVYGDFTITAVFADHTTDSIGVIIEFDGVKLYFTGDTLMNNLLYKVKELKPDIIFACINGKFGNMNWQDAVKLSKALGVKTAIPMHYDMFAINQEDPASFTSSFEGSGIRSFTLERDKWYDVTELIK